MSEPIEGHVVGEGEPAGPRWPGLPEHQIVRDPITLTRRCRCSEVSFTEEWLAMAPPEYRRAALKTLVNHVHYYNHREG